MRKQDASSERLVRLPVGRVDHNRGHRGDQDGVCWGCLAECLLGATAGTPTAGGSPAAADFSRTLGSEGLLPEVRKETYGFLLLAALLRTVSRPPVA